MKETSGYGLNVVSQHLFGLIWGGGPVTDALSSDAAEKKSVMCYFEKICLVSGFSLKTSIKCYFKNGAHCSFMYGCNRKL
jgi:hypothetical protein